MTTVFNYPAGTPRAVVDEMREASSVVDEVIDIAKSAGATPMKLFPRNTNADVRVTDGGDVLPNGNTIIDTNELSHCNSTAIATVGIDPGGGGAVALLLDGVFCEVVDFDRYECREALIRWNLLYDIRLAILEQVGPKPQDGRASLAKFMTNYGWWQCLLEVLQIPHVYKTPRAWHKGLGIPKKQKPSDKPALPVARRMFPGAAAVLTRVKDADRGEAILMAWQAFQEIRKG